MKPRPPCWASAIARCDSVTVSIAALTMGMFSEILRVSLVRVSASAGNTSLREGTRSTSSKVSPSGIAAGIIFQFSVMRKRAAAGIFLILLARVANLEHRKERLLRNIHAPHALHPLLAFLLFFEQLPFARNIAAVALGENVFPQRRNRFPGDDLRSDRRLQRNLEHLPRNQLAHPLDQLLSAVIREIAMHDHR